jgi:hypothetical protein
LPGTQPYEPVWLLLTVLAVWRLTALVTYEEGPFGIFVAVRRGLVRVGMARLMGCFYCLSLWISCAAVLVFPVDRNTPLVILAVAGAVAIIERALTGSPTSGAEQEADHNDL